MTAPGGVAPNEFAFVDVGNVPQDSFDVGATGDVVPVDGVQAEAYPPAILSGVTDAQMSNLKLWLSQRLRQLELDQQPLQDKWADYEEAYRAPEGAPKTIPFEGASTVTVPVVAMAVDPIHARLDTGIFKQDPVLTLKALRKNMVQIVPSLSAWIQYYQLHKLHLRRKVSPALLELCKLGTTVLKTTYDRTMGAVKGYDENFQVVKRDVVAFRGPQVKHVQLGDLLFSANFQHIQDCPIVFERIRTTIDALRVQEASKKITNVDELKEQGTVDRTPLEDAREQATDHQTSNKTDDIVIYQAWCKFDLDGDGIPENLVITWHDQTKTILELRYNWYFHQKYPYTVIPYTVTNESIYGLGVCEQTAWAQVDITAWQRMAEDNAYIANIRMFVAKRESGIEQAPRLYAGRTFFVDDPKNDFVAFQAGEIYPSTVTERQNIFGLVERRTGVSDYLMGRESPVIGSRATATSTLALIQQGTMRVEEVMENIRFGLQEVIEFCMYIWIQYGLDGLDDIVFEEDKIAQDLKELFSKLTAENVNGALAIDLTVADAENNRVSMQQMQLQVIQVMMTYLEKVMQLGAQAVQMQQQGIPVLAEMAKEIMGSARAMFRDLLNKYDIRNPDEYLPDLEKFLDANANGGAPAESGAAAGPGGSAGGPAFPASVPAGGLEPAGQPRSGVSGLG